MSRALLMTATALAATVSLTAASAQEPKPVPKDSARVAVVGCTKGYIFTAVRRTIEAPGSFDLREGTHLRMNGPRKLINEIKAHEGSTIEITGLMKKDQYMPGGVAIGGGVRIGPPPAGVSSSPAAGQGFIDVEGWRLVPAGSCPTR